MIPGIEQLLEQCAPQVAPVTMAAIMRVESAGNPWALNVNGRRPLTRQPGSRDEAVRWARTFVAAGYSVDMGLMQVNSGNLPRLNMTVEQVFEPCNNLAAGARILAAFYGGAARQWGEGQQALQAALSAYNTGNHQGGFRNGYVGKVVATAYRPLPNQNLAFASAARTPPPLGEPLVLWVRKPGAAADATVR